MRVLFIYPNIDCPAGANHGLVSLSGVLKANGHETRMIYACDAVEPVPTHEQMAEVVRDWKPALLAFSVMTQQYPWTVETAKALRARFPSIQPIALRSWVPWVTRSMHRASSLSPREWI